MPVLTRGDMKELDVLSTNKLGIVSKNSSSYLREDSKVLVIGLGGMGQEAVCQLKLTLTKNIGTPDPNRIQFLILDTATNELSDRLKGGDVDETEFIKLHSEQLRAMFDNEEKMPQEIKDIIKKGFRVNLDGSGANQVRLAGRLTLSEPTVFAQIHKKLHDSITALKDVTRKHLYIYIVAGIGGGTGSGLVVDVSYLARHICADLQLQNTKIMGSIFLPNVHKDQKNIEYAYRNGYAALKEIDYYMTIKEIQETYTATFPGLTVSSHENIFERCTLIGGEVPDMPQDDPRNFAVKIFVENMISLVTKTISPDKDKEGQDVFFVDSFLNNKDATLGTTFGKQDPKRFPRNANYVYCGVGAASLYFPNVPILEYLVGNVYNKMTKKLEQNPTKLEQKEVDEFEEELGIKPETLIQPLLNRFGQYVAREIGRHTITRGDIRNFANNIEITCRNKMPNHNLPSYDQLKGEVISKCNSMASEIFGNDAKGPYYLAEIIESNSNAGGNIKGLLEKFDEYRKFAENIKNKANSDYNEKKRTLDDQVTFMINNPGLFGGKFRRNLDTYRQTLKEICVHELQIKLADALTKHYFKGADDREGLNYDLRKNLENHHLYFRDVVKCLGEIMDYNVKETKYKVFEVEEPDNILSLSDNVFQNIKNKVTSKLRTEISEYDGAKLNSFTTRFLDTIVRNKNDWRMTEERANPETRCVKSFREFVESYFGDYSQTSLSKYLDNAYGDESQQVKSRLAHEIVNTLFNKASVAYNTWSGMSLANVPTLEFKYVIMPDSMRKGTNPWSNEFQPAVSQGVSKSQIMYSPDENTLFCYDLYACLPLWMHFRIKDYELEYYKHMANGVHTNESTELYPPYLEYPSPFIKETWSYAKAGTKEHTNPKEQEFCDKLQYAFDLGLEYGIIKEQDNGGFNVIVANLPQTDLPLPTFALIKKDGKKSEVQAEGEMSDEVRAFVQDYIADESNTDDNGRIVKDGFYKQLCDKFGDKSKEIKPNHEQSSGLKADSKENAVLLLRKQMKLTGDLLSMLSALQAMHNLIDEENNNRNSELWQNDFYKFMLYDLITSEDGKWYYFDFFKKKKERFTSRKTVIQHEDTKIKNLADFMEFAAFKLFIELPNYEKIHDRLKKEQKYRSDSVEDGDYTDISEEDVVANCKKYESVAQGVHDKYSREIRIETLTNDEAAIVDFYTGLANLASELLKSDS